MNSSLLCPPTRRLVLNLILCLAASIFLNPLHALPFDSPLSYEKYAQVLKEYVDDQGRVNYAGLKAKNRLLTDFLGELADLSETDYQSWSRADRIAFWINAYNAYTLKAIIDHYPIQASFLRGLAYPKNSIRQIKGVWDKLRFPVKGEELTLDQMEHQVLRKQFAEARIHMALVCAALSCPQLRPEPYQGSRLNQQFEEQTRAFLSRADNFRLESGTLYLSKIFDWFRGDFTPRYGRLDRVGQHGSAKSAVLQFLIPHLDQASQEALRSGDFRIRYSDYDWTLNEQP